MNNLLLDFHDDESPPLLARTVTRWKSEGVVKTLGVIPRKVDRYRIAECLRQTRYYWEEIVDFLTDEELAFIDYLFLEKKQSSTWMDVIMDIYEGKI